MEDITIDYVGKGYPYYKSLAELWDLGFNTLDKLHRLIEGVSKNKGNMLAIEALLNEIGNITTEPELSYNPYKELVEMIECEGKCQ